MTPTFYVEVLGMQPVTFGNGRRALVLGNQKINLHVAVGPIRSVQIREPDRNLLEVSNPL